MARYISRHMAYATGTDGTQIFYETQGQTGPWVVLIQGLGLSSTFWFDLPARLVADDPPYRVVLVDNRGVGRSDRPRGFYRMADMADDIAAVLDAAQIERAFVVGISLGGMIAQHLAIRHPERVAGLALLATTPGLPHGAIPPLRSLATLLSLPLRERRRVGSGLRRILLPEKLLPRVDELLGAWPVALRAEPTSARSFFSQLIAAALHSTGFRLREIRCPTVIVTGEEDILVSPKNSRILASRIPNAKLEVIPGAGHGIPLVDERVIHRALAALQPRAASER